MPLTEKIQLSPKKCKNISQFAGTLSLIWQASVPRKV